MSKAGLSSRRSASPPPRCPQAERSAMHSPAGRRVLTQACRWRHRPASAAGERVDGSLLRLTERRLRSVASRDLRMLGVEIRCARAPLDLAEGRGETALHTRAGHDRFVPTLHVREIGQIDLVALMAPGPAEDREIGDRDLAGGEFDLAEPAIEDTV